MRLEDNFRTYLRLGPFQQQCKRSLLRRAYNGSGDKVQDYASSIFILGLT